MVTLGPLAARLAAASAASLPRIPTWLGIQLSLTRLPCATRLCRLPRMVVMSLTLSLGCGCWRACSPVQESVCITTVAPGGLHGMFEGVLVATSSVWSVEQLLDVRQDSSAPPVVRERGTCSATIRVDRAVSEVYTAVPLGDLGHGHQRVLPQLPGAKKYKAGISPPVRRVSRQATGGSRGDVVTVSHLRHLVTLPGATGCGYVMYQRGGGAARSTPNITSLGVWGKP
ncbi:hypothetical protein GWK47_035824 [Chionoecetes opilio]|uniref:Uncharacterized protein n=1 Tax=Chionoecetes opilio TaxID=41210 RepID=A0A8J4YGF2_CHIOP|nr:hypothetical protein GWK47_035824 [Chionoecetes opilio]